jgi:hypothetical protein
VLHGRFFASPGFEKMAAETDSIDRRFITFRSADFGGPASTSPIFASADALKSEKKVCYSLLPGIEMSSAKMDRLEKRSSLKKLD